MTTSKGATTRDAILERAYLIACTAGLEGLSIGPLAQAVGMSKSGVFAHFGSREELQLAVLDAGAARFAEAVFMPALRAPRGLARLHAMMAAWFDWVRHDTDGGCLFLAAATEYDDQPGPLRDRLVQHETRWRTELGRAVGIAIGTGELRIDTDPEQLAFELYALVLMVHHEAGLFGYERARVQGERAFERLIRSCST